MKTPASGESRCSLKVLILGGYGAMAQSTVPDLLASPGVERVGIAGRSAAKAESFAAAQRDDRATAVPVDARDSAALVREMKRWDCVINSSWYDLNVPIMEAAIEAGIHYCDLGGLYHETLRQLKLDGRAKDAGVTCILGIGSTPGTMNVLGMYGASKLDKVEKELHRRIPPRIPRADRDHRPSRTREPLGDRRRRAEGPPLRRDVDSDRRLVETKGA